MKSLKRIFFISTMAFKEIFRSRVYGFIIFFSILLTACTPLFIDFTSQEQEKFLKDIGLTFITFFSLVLGIVLGTLPVQNDIESKNIYIFATNPTTVLQYLIGRLFGSVLLIVFAIVLMSIIFYVNLIIQKLSFLIDQTQSEFNFLHMVRVSMEEGFFLNAKLLEVFFIIFLQGVIMYSISLLFSVFLSVSFAIGGSILVFIFGHLGDFVHQALLADQGLPGYALRAFLLFIPNFANFNIMDAVVLGQNISLEYIGWLIVYSFLFLVMYLLFSYERISKKVFNL